MLKKLKSVLESPRGLLSLLVLKAILFLVLLVFLGRNSIWLAGFFLIVLYLYFRDSLNVEDFLSSFLILLSGSLIAIRIPAQDNFWFAVGVATFFAILFFVLMGIKNLIFIHRTVPYYFLNSLLFSVVFILFFYFDKSNFFAFKYLLSGLAILFLFREFLDFNRESIPNPIQSSVLAKKNLLALALAFLTLEFMWVVSLLPIGFLNSASSLLLFILVLDDLLLHLWSGTINRHVVLRNTTIFLLINVLIFMFSRWTL